MCSLLGAKLSAGITTFTEVICLTLNILRKKFSVYVFLFLSSPWFLVYYICVYLFLYLLHIVILLVRFFNNDIPYWDKYVYFNFMRFVYFKYLCTFQYFSMICTISMELSLSDVFAVVREQLEQSWRSSYTENIRFNLLFCYSLGFLC